MNHSTAPAGERTPAVALDSGMSKTLHHGLEILEVLSRHPHGLSISDLAEAVGVHRTVAHRLVRTLEAHRLCRRDDAKRITLGTGLVTLAEPVEQDLRTVARPVMEDLAERTRATVHLVLRESEFEVRALVVVEPRNAEVHVAFRPGQVHPIDRGSAGLAMLAALPPAPGERPEVEQARRRGYAVTRGEVVSTVYGISALIPRRRGAPLSSIGISIFDIDDEPTLATAVAEAARQLGTLLH